MTSTICLFSARIDKVVLFSLGLLSGLHLGLPECFKHAKINASISTIGFPLTLLGTSLKLMNTPF